MPDDGKWNGPRGPRHLSVRSSRTRMAARVTGRGGVEGVNSAFARERTRRNEVVRQCPRLGRSLNLGDDHEHVQA
jgi:hypothetical protein